MTDAAVPAIDLANVERRFGALLAVRDVTLRVAPGERHAVLGPNGAGKTTLFNAICGDFPSTAGTIKLFGEEISHMPAHRRARRGIGRTYQNSLLFNGLSVLDNIYVAVRGVKPNRFSFRAPRADDPDRVFARDVAMRVRLGHLLDIAVGDLSHGQRRQLEVGMALASNPRLLMLDEPAAGLSPVERPELSKLLRDLPRTLTILLIEHDMDVALPFADLVTVMKDGAVVVSDTPGRIQNDPVVHEIYLGHGGNKH